MRIKAFGTKKHQLKRARRRREESGMGPVDEVFEASVAAATAPRAKKKAKKKAAKRNGRRR